MTNYREVLRLQTLGLNHSQIAASAELSRPTVIKILRLARAKGLDWRAVEELSDRELGERLYPKEASEIWLQGARLHMGTPRVSQARRDAATIMVRVLRKV